MAMVFQPHPSKKKVVIASVDEFRIVALKEESFVVKNSLTHFGGGFSASVSEFRIVPVKKKVVVASVGEFRIVPIKKEGRLSLGR